MNIRVGYSRQHTQGLHKSHPTLVPLLSASEEGRARSRRGPNHPYEAQIETSYPEAYRSPEAVIRMRAKVVHACMLISLNLLHGDEAHSVTNERRRAWRGRPFDLSNQAMQPARPLVHDDFDLIGVLENAQPPIRIRPGIRWRCSL